MQVIMLSGGSGKRLWPLSNEVRSKQFLRVIQNGEGERESMAQRLYRQITDSKLQANITVVTSMLQVESIKKQLGDKVSILIEPSKRNTYPAIMLSAAYLKFEKNCSLKETIIVLPVDSYVDSEYFVTLKKLDNLIQQGRADIALMGVRPTYPSEKYGYIIPENIKDDISNVMGFREKPDAVSAEKIIAMGGLWNCGVFAFRLSYLVEILGKEMKCNSYADILMKWEKLNRISFDYAVLEKGRSMVVVPYCGVWEDLGTWDTLTDVIEENTIGNVYLSEDCINTHIINELELPIVVMGAKDMIIASSPDGILVADKKRSSCVKKYVDQINMRPMFEERVWGNYTVLNISQDQAGNKVVTIKKNIIAGSIVEKSFCSDQAKVWTVLTGKAIIEINGYIHEALPGDTYRISANAIHCLTAIENTTLLEVQIENSKKI